jgi:hypothetical protein
MNESTVERLLFIDCIQVTMVGGMVECLTRADAEERGAVYGQLTLLLPPVKMYGLSTDGHASTLGPAAKSAVSDRGL